MQVPPLITASTDEDLLGKLDAEQTTVLMGGERIHQDASSGFRLRMGTWLDCQQTQGLEGGFFLVSPGSLSARAGSSDGSLIVGRPFIAIQGNGNPVATDTAQLVSGPGLGGFVDVRSSWSLLGAELLFRQNLCVASRCSCDSFSEGESYCMCAKDGLRTGIRRDLLVGFRYLNYSDSITIREQLETLDPPPDVLTDPGTRFDMMDSFRAHNDFYGITLGMDCLRNWGRWSLETRPQLHVGVLDRRVSIRGEKSITYFGEDPVEYAGGLLALESNLGHYRSSQFAVIPELDLQVGYRIRPRTRILLGYSCLLLPGLARAGEQIDLAVNPDLVPPADDLGSEPVRPAYAARRSNAWIQGVTTGLEFRW